MIYQTIKTKSKPRTVFQSTPDVCWRSPSRLFFSLFFTGISINIFLSKFKLSGLLGAENLSLPWVADGHFLQDAQEHPHGAAENVSISSIGNILFNSSISDCVGANDSRRLSHTSNAVKVWLNALLAISSALRHRLFGLLGLMPDTHTTKLNRKNAFIAHLNSSFAVNTFSFPHHSRAIICDTQLVLLMVWVRWNVDSVLGAEYSMDWDAVIIFPSLTWMIVCAVVPLILQSGLGFSWLRLLALIIHCFVLAMKSSAPTLGVVEYVPLMQCANNEWCRRD